MLPLRLLAGVGLVRGARIAQGARMGFESDILMELEDGDLSNSTSSVDGSNCDELWHPELDKMFKNKQVWGSGATACVFGGTDETGTLVAIKVGKPTETIAGWRAECGEMQMMRYNACQDGEISLALHQEYIPTCTRVGQTKDKQRNYYVMHAGGIVAYRDLPKKPLTEDQKRSIFSQLVASVYALHRVDYTHNDLHGQNIVLTEDYKLALIDFGSLKTRQNANTYGYKRDTNAIWRWGAVVFGCPENAQWLPDLPTWTMPTSERYSRAGNFHKCLKDHGASAATISVIKKMTDSCVQKKVDQHMAEVYETDFVQEALPKLNKVFPFASAQGCLKWDDAKFQSVRYKAQFGGHYKCDTTPNWTTKRIKTRRGKEVVRLSKQCNVPELKSACFTTTKGVHAACGGGLNIRLPCENLPMANGQYYSGGCLKENHPAYEYALTWGA